MNVANWQAHLSGFFCGISLLLPTLIISKGAAIGGGDIKLMAVAGLYLGCLNILLAFFVANLLGSIIHPIKMKFAGVSNQLAMGPYLSVGFGVALLWGTLILERYIFVIIG